MSEIKSSSILSNMSNMSNPPTPLKFNHKSTFNKLLGKTLKNLIVALKITAGTSSVILSEGSGADVIVAIVFAVIDSGSFLNDLKKSINDISHEGNVYMYLKDILDINFKNGPDGVRKQTKNILKKMVQNKDINEIIIINDLLKTIYESITVVFGDWISSFIPDSGSVIGVTISEMISSPNEKTYYKLLYLYNMLPDKTKKLFENPDDIEKLLNNILYELKKGLISEKTDTEHDGKIEQKGSGILSILKPRFGLMEYLGIDKIIYSQAFDLINRLYEPNIKLSIDVIKIIFPLLFSILTINECVILCEN